MNSMAPLVHILTFCSHPTSAYGSLLVFDSVRTGFPTAQIEVYDNGSCAEVLPAIEQAAKRVGARFDAQANRHYSEHLRWVLLEREHREGVPLVLCDPDVIFWEAVEQWDFAPALLAGRLIPMLERAGKAFPRLHPSLLFIPDVHELRRAVKEAEACSFAWDCIGPRTSWINGQAYFWDTLSDLYQALTTRCVAFGEDELNSYDHLFCGTHLGVVGASQDDELKSLYIDVHRLAAKGEISALRGVWRRQQAVFEISIAPPSTSTGEQARAGMLATSRLMAEWTGQAYADDELWTSVQRIGKSIAIPQRKPEANR